MLEDVAEPLHPDCEHLASLLGTWRGRGHGDYPTIEPFTYLEVVTFGHVGKPFLTYTQRTRHAGDGRPLHSETGYWRCIGPDRVEVVLAHPTGVTTVEDGRVDGGRIMLVTTSIGLSPTAKRVERLERTFVIDGDTITYTVDMAAMGRPLTRHLDAELERA